MLMQNEKDTQMKNELRGEIVTLQRQYHDLTRFLAGTEYDALEIVGTLQAFKENLNRISAYILTLYTLKGQKTKITWEPLIANIGNAIEAISKSARPNIRTAVSLSLSMSEPNANEVMTYLEKLKESLK